METFLLLCKPIVVKNFIKPDVHECRVVLRRCDTEKCVILPAEKSAPPVKVEAQRDSRYDFQHRHHRQAPHPIAEA